RRTQALVKDLQQEMVCRKRTEQALREAQHQLELHATELEKHVAERTEALAETVRSLEELLYHIAHNLRAPLRAMEGYTSLLLVEHKSELDAFALEHCRHISEAASRMDEL